MLSSSALRSAATLRSGNIGGGPILRIVGAQCAPCAAATRGYRVDSAAANPAARAIRGKAYINRVDPKAKFMPSKAFTMEDKFTKAQAAQRQVARLFCGPGSKGSSRLAGRSRRRFTTEAQPGAFTQVCRCNTQQLCPVHLLAAPLQLF